MDVILSVIFASLAGYIASLFFGYDQLPFIFYLILGVGGTIVVNLLLALIGFSVGGILSILASILGSVLLLKVFTKEAY